MHYAIPATVYTALIASVVTIMVAVGLVYNVTSLRVTITSDVAIVDLGGVSPAEKLSVTFDGVPVPSLRAYEIEVWNDGTRPIRSRDFESDLVFSSLSKRDILSAEIRAQPSDANANIEVRDGNAALAPLLLNPSDRVSVGLISTAADIGDIHASARIAGVGQVAVTGPDEDTDVAENLAVIVVLLVAILVASMAPYSWRWLSGRTGEPFDPTQPRVLGYQILGVALALQVLPLVLVVRQLPNFPFPTWVGIASVSEVGVALVAWLVLDALQPTRRSQLRLRVLGRRRAGVLGYDKFVDLCEGAPTDTSFDVIGIDEDGDVHVRARRGKESAYFFAGKQKLHEFREPAANETELSERTRSLLEGVRDEIRLR